MMNLRLVGIVPLVGVDWQNTAGERSKTAEIWETCDVCGREVLARNIYFDGDRFLCLACRQKRASHLPAESFHPQAQD